MFTFEKIHTRGANLLPKCIHVPARAAARSWKICWSDCCGNWHMIDRYVDKKTIDNLHLGNSIDRTRKCTTSMSVGHFLFILSITWACTSNRPQSA